MDTKIRIGILVGFMVVLSVLVWGVSTYFVGEENGPKLDEPVAVFDDEDDGLLEEEAEGLSDAERDRVDEEFLAWMEGQAVLEDSDEEEIAGDGQVNLESEVAVVESGPVASEDASDSGGGMPRWRSIWANLNLTPEEEARMREGFGIEIAKYMSMSPAEQVAKREEMEEMRRRWEGMGDDEKAEASQRMRDRVEDWRQSGSIELPELTLD